MEMMKPGKTVSAALIIGGLLVALSALSGCQKEEGPAEQVGEDIDKATEQAGEKIEQVGESIQDAAKGDKD